MFESVVTWIGLDSIRFDSNVNSCIHFSWIAYKVSGKESVTCHATYISIPIKVYSLFCAKNIKTHANTSTPRSHYLDTRRRAIVRFYFKTFHPYVIPSFKVYLVFFSFSCGKTNRERERKRGRANRKKMQMEEEREKLHDTNLLQKYRVPLDYIPSLQGASECVCVAVAAIKVKCQC